MIWKRSKHVRAFLSVLMWTFYTKILLYIKVHYLVCKIQWIKMHGETVKLDVILWSLLSHCKITLHLYKPAMNFDGGSYLGRRHRVTLRTSSWGQFPSICRCVLTCPLIGVGLTDSCAKCNLLPLLIKCCLVSKNKTLD